MQTGRIPCSSINSQNEMQVRKGKSKTYVFRTGEKNMNLRINRQFKTSHEELISKQMYLKISTIIFHYFKENLVKSSVVRKYI